MNQKKRLFGFVSLVAVLGVAGLLLLRTLAFDGAEQSYREDFSPDRDPARIFGGNLLLGTDNGWSGRLAEGRYVLENQGHPGDVRYFYLRPEGLDIVQDGSRAMLEVDGEFSAGEGPSGAGLLYGFDPGTGHYLAFVIMAQGQYAVLQRDEDGVQMRMSGTHGTVRRTGRNRLAIDRSGRRLRFAINGREVASLGMENVEGRGVGLLALGNGRFAFDNFVVTGKALSPELKADGTAGVVRGAQAMSIPDPPRGFRSIRHEAGSGELWLSDSLGGNSARRAMVEMIGRLGNSFQGPPALHAVIGDGEDRELRALFSARHGERELRGLLVTARSDKGVVALCLFDAPGALARSFGPLVQTASAHLPAIAAPPRSRPRAVAWQQVRLPDGSGTMKLPTDWKIVGASQGMVDAAGADGSMVSLGIHGPVLTPEAGAGYYQMPGATVRVPVAPYSDPVTALGNLFPQFGYQAPQRIVRLIDTAATPWPHNGQAAYVHFDWQQGEGAQARNYTSLALFGVMPGYGQWTFYLSIVSAPKPLFSQNLPMLMEIWQNWQVADHVHRQRLDQAAGSMREISNIIDQTHARRQQAQDRAAANWTEVFRDQTYLGDTRLGERYSVPLTQVEDWTRELNRAAGYERYRHIPLRDLQ